MCRVSIIRIIKNWIIMRFPRVVNAYGQWRHVYPGNIMLEENGFRRDYSFKHGVKYVRSGY